MPEELQESVQNIKKIGRSQYKEFGIERMVERTKPKGHFRVAMVSIIVPAWSTQAR